MVAAVLWRILLGTPSLHPLGLARLVVMPVAVGAGLTVGVLTDLVLPWVPAAALATVTYVTVAAALGLTAAADVPLRGVLHRITRRTRGDRGTRGRSAT